LRILDAPPAIVANWKTTLRRAHMADLVLDLVFVFTMLAFFALSSGLIRFCARLRDGRRG
jgi:hypothetical protein